jgi:thiamine pyrophosphate-dependent acetolactate synthase large subunit-like protein
MELATAVELRLPLLVVLINDAAYGAEVHDFAPTGVDVSVAQFTLKNWAGIAKVLGAEAKTVRELTDLDAIGSWLGNPAGPFLLDCQVDPTIDATTVMTDEGVAEWSCAD